MQNEEIKRAEAFNRFYGILARLRAPGGCPWDIAQTPLTMRSDLIEETFEAVEAITDDDALHVKEELGDVMLNASMIAYMFEQKNAFTMSGLLDEVSDKLVRRHPHVFPESEGKTEVTEVVKTSEQVLSQWDKIKQNVEGRVGDSILDEVSDGLPPLLKAAKYQKKAAKKGFDWDSLPPVFGKIEEELREVKEAVQKASDEKGQKHLEEEIGDLLFAVVNVARKLKIDPAIALDRTNRKFYNRFSYVEKKMKENNIPMENGYLEKMDVFWNEAKANEE